jgi:hypothetical protein
MPQLTIYMTDQDIAAAKRIALKMFPYIPKADDVQAVINVAATIGLDRMRVVWNEPEKNLEGIEK